VLDIHPESFAMYYWCVFQSHGMALVTNFERQHLIGISANPAETATKPTSTYGCTSRAIVRSCMMLKVASCRGDSGTAAVQLAGPVATRHILHASLEGVNKTRGVCIRDRWLPSGKLALEANRNRWFLITPSSN